MSKSNTGFENGEKRFLLITLILVLMGAVTLTCLLFFFRRSFYGGNSSTPVIYSAEQIGRTDTSVLISWACSENAKEFAVRYRETGKIGYSEFTTDQPFAALHELRPYCQYDVSITPVEGDSEFEPFFLKCDTAPYCIVTSVDIEEISADSALIKWQYEGMDAGFSIAAYAVDRNGKRHFSSGIMKIPAGGETQCRLTGLLSNLQYTVCVMPETRYMTVGKSTFTTSKYSDTSNNINIIRFVICSYRSENSFTVSRLTELATNTLFKTSIIYNGQASPEDKVDLTLYITDEDGNLISDFTQHAVKVNPNHSAAYVSRLWMPEFTSPEKPGGYYLYLAIDGVTVKRTFFTVV